jgi:mono/diheme cytochrome c family protein
MVASSTDEHREARPAEEPEEPGMPFFPDFALREALVALVVLAALLVAASLTTAPLEEEADPASAGYVPRPEWYFMWLFQSLKYFKGEAEMIGTFVLPTIAIGLLIMIPFLDRRRPHTHRLLPRTRPVRIWPRLAGTAVMAGIGYLTLVALTSSAPLVETEPRLTQVQAAGKALFDKMGCVSCHAIEDAGGTRGPDLTAFGKRPDAENRVLLHFTGITSADQSIMPGYQLSDEELSSLAAYLLSLKGG